ncbi:MAG: Prokaryotic dksA/traR C4-type zinc finger [Rubritepida sp.]|nr:Prokaryotic dksA/traR C4-type zinc finger [Rubritepida sp.]
MPDDMDRATALTEALTADAIQAARPRGEGSPTCVVCGEDIPARRRETMPTARHCVRCLEAMEKARAR